MEEMINKGDSKLDYTIDLKHNNLVFCNFCKKRFNILNIDGHIRREKEKNSENNIENHFTGHVMDDVDSHLHVKKND